MNSGESIPQSAAPLAGITVLDFTQFLSGPYGTQLLADLGAFVIKVEPPTGDSARSIRSHLVNGSSAYFASINRSKHSISIDLKQSEGRDVAMALISHADLVFENYRPGTLDRLGLSFEQLRRNNPSLVVCSITGFGQDGPYRDRPAYDVVVQALSGGMSLTGPTGGEPVRAGIPIADLCAGMSAVIGALSALLEARLTGRGRQVDISMLDVQISMLTYQATYFLTSGEVPGPQGRDHVSIPTYRSFRCADGQDIVVAANTDRMWRALCQAVGSPRLVDDPRFTSDEGRQENREALIDHLALRFETKTAREWDTVLAEHDVPAAPLNDLRTILTSDHVAARELIVYLNDGNGDLIPTVATPIRFVDSDPLQPTRPPRLGEHSREVLRATLNIDEEEIDQLAERGVIVDGSPDEVRRPGG